MRRLYLPAAALILLTAAILRLWLLHLYPPGPHYDEGAYLLITRSIAFGGAWFFPIVEAYQGREVLYMLLNAPLLHGFGDSIFTLRISSAFLNLLMIAAAIRLSREMFPGQRGILIALIVGTAAALSFPQIFIARQAFRAVTLPTMQAIALLLLWRALNAHRPWGWLIAAGFWSGAVIYTYMASRLFPVWLVLGAIVLLWTDRARWRMRLAQGAAFFGVLAVTALPMALYALRRPDVFWGRLEEVNQSGQGITLTESLILHARMFFIDGDPYFRYNVAHRPYFTWAEGLLLLIGLGVALWRIGSSKEKPTARAAYALALLSPLMVIPSVISLSGLPPSHMRSLGMIPMIFILLGVGAEWVWSKLTLRLSPDGRIRLFAAGLGLLLLIGGGAVGRLYFDWASDPALFYETDADLALAARWMRTQADDHTQIYLAARDRSHPTVLIEDTPPITWLGTDTLFIPPPGVDGVAIFPRSAPPPDDWRRWLATERVADTPLGPDGEPAFDAFRLNSAMDLPAAMIPSSSSIRNAALELLGTYHDPVPSGSAGELVTVWRVTQPAPFADLTPLIEIVDANNQRISRRDLYMTDTDHWMPNSQMLLRMPLDIPLATPPGDYTVRLAWVGRASDTYLQYLTEDRRQSGLWAEIATISAARPSVFPDSGQLSIAERVDAAFLPDVRLLGWDALAETLRPGEDLNISLYWRAEAETPVAGNVAIRLLGDSGDVQLHAGLPLATFYPPERWAAGEVLHERLRLPIPMDQPSGVYSVLIQSSMGEYTLGTLQIEGQPRMMTMPEIDIQVGADFGDQIRFVGYELEVAEDGGMALTLVWQALTVMSEDYTVFVHRVNRDGALIDQMDAMPVNNSYPTSLWMQGEYVVDQYLFPPVEPRPTAFEIGLYLLDTGARLLTSGQASNTQDFIRVILP